MTNFAIGPCASDLAAFLDAQGLPPPPLPAEIVRVMLAHGPGCFASGELQDDWRANTSLREIVLRWLDAGSQQPAARCELTGRGFHSKFVQVVFESPRCGVFLSKLVSEGFDDAVI